MAKKDTTKGADAKDATKPKEQKPKAEKPLVEKVAFKPVVEISATKPKTLSIEKGPKNGAKMLLKCHGNEDLKLGKGTDGNVIHCKNETHAVLEYSDVWQLMSVCKL